MEGVALGIGFLHFLPLEASVQDGKRMGFPEILVFPFSFGKSDERHVGVKIAGMLTHQETYGVLDGSVCLYFHSTRKDIIFHGTL